MVKDNNRFNYPLSIIRYSILLTFVRNSSYFFDESIASVSPDCSFDLDQPSFRMDLRDRLGVSLSYSLTSTTSR